jgi:murein DD-endopeptidase MepM/ murein hydrolase activator NlpD
MIGLFLAIAVFATDQGKAVQLTFPHEPGIKSLELRWQGKTVPFILTQDNWVTVVGVDLDTKPGDHPSDMLVTMNDGRRETRAATIQVRSTRFPTTELKVEERFVQLNPRDQTRSAREAQEISKIFATVTPEILWDKPFTIPIPGGRGSNFGHRRVFNGQPRAPHNGADLRAQTGTPIQSTNRGRVVMAKDLFFTGNTVIVDHGLGIYSLYAHLSRLDVKEGAIVENGQQVGLAGATGRVTGPHLHWGIRVQGARVDPFSLVNLESSSFAAN